MKKLTISFLIFFAIIGCLAGFASSVPVKADDYVSGENVPTITPIVSEEYIKTVAGTELLLEYLKEGGQVDFSNVNPSTTAEGFVDNFVDFIGDVLGYTVDIYNWAQPLDFLDVPNNRIQIKKANDDIRAFRSKLPTYLNNNTSVPTPDIPDTSNFPSYFYRINNIALSSGDFWFGAFSQNQCVAGTLLSRPTTYISYYAFNGAGFPYTDTDLGNTYRYIYYDIIDIYIVDDGNSVSYSLGTLNPLQYISNDNGQHYYYRSKLFTNNNLLTTGGTVSNSVSTPYAQSFSNLEDCCNHLYNRFRNVNIYYNGELYFPSNHYINNNPVYNITISDTTYIENSNKPIEYKYPVDVYIDLQDVLDRLQTLIDNQNKISFPDFSDLIIDIDGQQAVAVTILQEEYTIDDQYIMEYGPMIPIFPLWVNYPVDLRDVTTVATVGLVDVVPDDILELLGVFFIGTLCICMIHRLLE